MRDWLRLIRFPLAATAAWDALACLALALAAGGRGLATYGPAAWGLLALTSCLTYAFGMAANDIVDRARDELGPLLGKDPADVTLDDVNASVQPPEGGRKTKDASQG